MSHPATIHAFTKPDCDPCARAKALLNEAGLQYIEHDVTATKRNADASVYFSGMATVPQIFIGSLHVNGSKELARLGERGRLEALLQAANGSELRLDQVSDEELAGGAEDVPLTGFIPQSDGARDDDPEMWPLNSFYKQWFGLYPNSFLYMHNYPEAMKLFVYGHNFSAFAFARQNLSNVEAIGFASCEAAECSYCTTHTVAAGGEKSLKEVSAYKKARDGDGDGGVSPHILALGALSAAASLNTVTDQLLDRVRETGEDAKTTEGEIQATALIGATSGFLNVFNDLVDMEIEADWAAKSSTVGVAAGRHGVDSGASARAEFNVPEHGPSMEDVLAKYNGLVGDLDAYADREFGFLPAWIQAWPAQLQGRHAYMYGELMGERDHSLFSSEFKHLMARVSAIAKGHDYLAAVEALLAVRAAGDKDRAVQRVARCFEAATALDDGTDLPFDDRERAALTIAWLSAQTPVTTPRRFLQPALDTFNAKELVQLCIVCALASLVQRFVAIARPEMEGEVVAFLRQHELEADTLLLRYPVAGKLQASAA